MAEHHSERDDSEGLRQMDADIESCGLILPDKKNKWLSNKTWKLDYDRRLNAKNNGDLIYYTLRPCIKGHNKRYVKTNHCIECLSLAKIRYRKRNSEHVKKLKTKHHLNHLYGISSTEYDRLSISQNHVCAICKQSETALHHKTGKPRKLAVDHCHNSNKIRGLLCNNCNTALGKFNDSAELLQNAINYLK